MDVGAEGTALVNGKAADAGDVPHKFFAFIKSEKTTNIVSG